MHDSYDKWLKDGCPKIYCQCGCNREIIITQNNKYRGIPKYISGHNRRGIPHTNDVKLKISKANENNKHNLGRKASDKTRKLMSDNRCGENNGMFGKHQLEETKIKISISNKGHIAWNKGLTKEIDERVNKISQSTVNKPKSQEHKDKLSQSRLNGNYVGENHPNWRGGISKLPYCYKWTKKLREEIRKRDDYICQMPGCLCTQLESLILYSKVLFVHHVHYDKENCNPDLITLCNSCSTKVNSNREYWENLFMKILNERKLIKIKYL